ncbi:MAG: DUF2207 domain-containing protein, partial [Elusimicrobiaceae bacterium]|nr:DUF2207 domain-containing protein [Elusimicrobiaceae bacterium]
MKKLLLFVSFFVFSVCSVFAEISYDPEKIYLFDAKITVQQNGEIQVTEDITLNAQHIKIRRGIVRDLPNSIAEHAHNISLTMDGEKHPFFTETHDGSLFINFGNDDYISKGKHTYSLTYSYVGAINFFQDYDE